MLGGNRERHVVVQDSDGGAKVWSFQEVDNQNSVKELLEDFRMLRPFSLFRHCQDRIHLKVLSDMVRPLIERVPPLVVHPQ